ncbi:hypothetical protein HUB98_01355 [Paenibacillus barcinonensis]|uniref:Uncharacterized protein n=2 Tax=Paenibacillus barcinonensis TaxID=198119 RepID=A0ABX6PYS6_PAEBA|nr:hypothetical protein [Paenibacillus barcinonensis]QKS55089.1 hypothetical protein HUB98_01355 [Paenibacillus barcinonensis]
MSLSLNKIINTNEINPRAWIGLRICELLKSPKGGFSVSIFTEGEVGNSGAGIGLIYRSSNRGSMSYDAGFAFFTGEHEGEIQRRLT